jgi:hypothetical protein
MPTLALLVFSKVSPWQCDPILASRTQEKSGVGLLGKKKSGEIPPFSVISKMVFGVKMAVSCNTIGRVGGGGDSKDSEKLNDIMVSLGC